MHYFPDASSYFETQISIEEVPPQAQVVLREAIMRMQMFRTGFKKALFEPEVVQPSPAPKSISQRELRRMEKMEREM